MRRGFGIALSLVVGLFLLACLGFALPIDAAVALGLGWALYLLRVVPEVRPGASGLLTGAVCLIAFTIGAHRFLQWLHGRLRQTPEGEADRPREPWPFRRTAALAAIVVLMFVAGLAASGLAHQVGWLVTSGEPLVDLGPGRRAAWRAHSANNLKQIGLGVNSYAYAMEALPAGATEGDYGRLLHGWQTLLLPYVEQSALYDRVDLDRPWDDPRNEPVFREKVGVYLHPAYRRDRDDQGYALSHYAGNAHVLGGTRRVRFEEMTDGTSATILAGEIPDRFVPWGRPGNWRDPARGVNRSPDGFGGPGPGGANFLMADGSVRFLKDTIDPRVLQALGTPAGGEAIPTASP